ncbi:MAG: hypothetical protein EOP00_33100 [Pedobacter sp.]|nr:MAG: hypothetical protein EOP00_33100 [Pedobacter sp.]
MKRIILSAILFIGMSTIAFAQQDIQKKERKTPEDKAQHVTDALGKKLSLTADQKSKVYAISLGGLKNNKRDHIKGQKPDRSLMKAELEKRDQQILAVLNTDQKTIYQQWKKEKMESMKKHRKDNRRTDKI